MKTTTSRRTAAIALAGMLLTATPAVVSAQSAMQTAPAHKNMIQKHPYATGIAAAWATHHALKVAAARDKRMGKKLNWAERHPTLSGIGVGTVTTHEIKAHTPQ